MRRFVATVILVFGLGLTAFASDTSKENAEPKSWIAAIGIGATLLVSIATLAHSLKNDKRVSFVNTVSSSRLKWIDSLRDSSSEFLAVTSSLLNRRPYKNDEKTVDLLLRRDTLVHQIVLHLNPADPEDQKIKGFVDHVRELTDNGSSANDINSESIRLRDATAEYLKKEWNRVKSESTKGSI